MIKLLEEIGGAEKRRGFFLDNIESYGEAQVLGQSFIKKDREYHCQVDVKALDDSKENLEVNMRMAIHHTRSLQELPNIDSILDQ